MSLYGEQAFALTNSLQANVKPIAINLDFNMQDVKLGTLYHLHNTLALTQNVWQVIGRTFTKTGGNFLILTKLEQIKEKIWIKLLIIDLTHPLDIITETILKLNYLKKEIKTIDKLGLHMEFTAIAMRG